MELNQLSFVARLRSPWQVFDLTQLFIRPHFMTLLVMYLIMAVPVAIVIALIFSPAIATMVVWWLKPIFERPILDYLSKCSFSQALSIRSSLRSISAVGWKNAILALTLFRFSPNRAYLAPVEQLEGQSGGRSVKRKNLLKGRCDHKQTFWLMLCAHLELLIILILFLMVYNFIPQGINIDAQFFSAGFNIEAFDLVYSIIYVIAVSLVAPLFATGGFLMYLNSRIKLEAWDIELAFKRIATRLSCVLWLCCFFGSFTSTEIYAQSTDNTATLVQPDTSVQQYNELLDVKQQVDDIYLQHNLIDKQQSWIPSSKTAKERELDSGWLEALFSAFTVFSTLSPIVMWLFWAALFGLITWIIWHVYLARDKWFSRPLQRIKTTEKEVELPQFFTDLVQVKRSTDVLADAEQALQNQQSRLALMYILNFALLYAEQQQPGVCHSSMTEQECETALLLVMPITLHQQYQQLFAVWIKQAWGHIDATQGQVTCLLTDFRVLKEGGAGVEN
jgi:hypothetical protein